MAWGFILQVPCVLQIFWHIPFVCAGGLQDAALPMEWEKLWSVRLPWMLCPCFGTVLERRKDGAGTPESPNSTSSSTQDLLWASHRSFHSLRSFLCSWGWPFHIFWGTKQDPSLQALAGAGLGAFPKETASPRVTLQLLGLHRAHYPSPSLAPQLPT